MGTCDAKGWKERGVRKREREREREIVERLLVNTSARG